MIELANPNSWEIWTGLDSKSPLVVRILEGFGQILNECALWCSNSGGIRTGLERMPPWCPNSKVIRTDLTRNFLRLSKF